jgi:hypothetical protein
MANFLLEHNLCNINQMTSCTPPIRPFVTETKASYLDRTAPPHFAQFLISLYRAIECIVGAHFYVYTYKIPYTKVLSGCFLLVVGAAADVAPKRK